MNDKRGVAQYYLVISLLAGLITILNFGGILETGSLDTNPDYIQVPYTPTISCSPGPGGDKSFTGTIATKGEWISDKLPDNTKSWSITLIGPSGISGKQFEYYICPQRNLGLNNCRHEFKQFSGSGGQLSLGAISSTQHVWVQYQTVTAFGYKEYDGATFSLTYTPYQLLRDDSLRGGKQYLSEELGCVVPYSDPSWVNRIISAIGIDVDTAQSRSLEPDEKFNYISGTIPRLSSGNTQDGGYCIYSNGKGNIYPINELVTATDKYYVVDVNQNPIKTVQCCNGDNLPDKTCVQGQWELTQNAECSIINPCEGSEWRSSLNEPQTAIKYSCVQGMCQAQTKAVECSISSDCSTNQYCDTDTFTCKQASTSGGDGIARGVSITEGWPWYVWVAIFLVGGIGLYFIWPYIMNLLIVLRSALKSIPIIGRFF